MHLRDIVSGAALLAELSARLSLWGVPLGGASVDPVGGVGGAFAGASPCCTSSGELGGEWSPGPSEEAAPSCAFFLPARILTLHDISMIGTSLAYHQARISWSEWSPGPRAEALHLTEDKLHTLHTMSQQTL